MRKTTNIPPIIQSALVVLTAMIICFSFMSAMAAWTNTFDTATPTGANHPNVIDDHIRLNKLAIQERLNVDHYAPLTGTSQSDTDGGKHRKVTFRSGAEDNVTTVAADEGVLYSKDVDGGSGAKAELYWRGEDDIDLQITELNTAGDGAALNLTGEYENELNLSNTGNTIYTDNMLCTAAGILNLPTDSTDTTEANLRYNTTDDTVEFRDSGAWDALMSVATTAISDAAYGTAVGEGADLSIDVGFAPDVVIGWNTLGGTNENRYLWLWFSADSSSNKCITTGGYVESQTHISVTDTTIKFPNTGHVNVNTFTMFYFAFNFRASVQNPS